MAPGRMPFLLGQADPPPCAWRGPQGKGQALPADRAAWRSLSTSSCPPTRGGRAAGPDPAAPGPGAGPVHRTASSSSCPLRTGPGGHHEGIANAGLLIARAAALKRPAAVPAPAAIVACHAEAKRWEDTDWTQIVVPYDMRRGTWHRHRWTRLHRAIALRDVTRPCRPTGRGGRAGGPAGRLPPVPRRPAPSCAATWATTTRPGLRTSRPDPDRQPSGTVPASAAPQLDVIRGRSL